MKTLIIAAASAATVAAFAPAVASAQVSNVTGYGSVGYIGLLFVLLPEIVVGTIKIRNNERRRKEQEQQRLGA